MILHKDIATKRRMKTRRKTRAEPTHLMKVREVSPFCSKKGLSGPSTALVSSSNTRSNSHLSVWRMSIWTKLRRTPWMRRVIPGTVTEMRVISMRNCMSFSCTQIN